MLVPRRFDQQLSKSSIGPVSGHHQFHPLLPIGWRLIVPRIIGRKELSRLTDINEIVTERVSEVVESLKFLAVSHAIGQIGSVQLLERIDKGVIVGCGIVVARFEFKTREYAG
jgi:hypothetical protein